VNIWGQLKNLEISKYKRESKGRIGIFVLFLLIVVLFQTLKSVKILKKACLQVEIFKCALSKVEVLHNLYRHYTKIKGADNQG
jgi:hypothetical protein